MVVTSAGESRFKKEAKGARATEWYVLLVLFSLQGQWRYHG